MYQGKASFPPVFCCISIFQCELLLVVDVDCFTQLYFDQLQFCFGNNSMAAACGHGDHVAYLHVLLYAVHNCPRLQ